MFDIGFSELVVIGIVALVVIGPERLPRAARTAGLLLGRLQRYVRDVKADVSREMQLEDLKNLRAEVQETARDFERSLVDEVKALEQSIGQTVDSARAEAEASGAAPARTDREPAAPSDRQGGNRV
jgi:sec-independent protein translocase protein TatB